jgi:hypothetical protein
VLKEQIAPTSTLFEVSLLIGVATIRPDARSPAVSVGRASKETRREWLRFEDVGVVLLLPDRRPQLSLLLGWLVIDCCHERRPREGSCQYRYVYQL